MDISGSCLCGSVRYTSSGKVTMAGNCHCINCKKATGSGYAPVLFVPKDSVEITGDVRYYQTTGKRGFCPNCGSSLFEDPAVENPGEFLSGMLGICAGSLDDLSQYKPEIDIFTSRSATWECMDPNLPKFSEMPSPD
ncbi:GFA family protein [Microbulbifer halophilus]